MGVLRVLLALFVIQFHGGTVFPSWFPRLDGREAVQAFYIISGFYMALVLNRKYRDGASNALFWSNRYLRLWPSYAAVAVLWLGASAMLGRLLLLGGPESWPGIGGKLGALPPTSLAFVLLSNVSMLGLDWMYLLGFGPDGMVWAPFGSSTAHSGTGYILNPAAFSLSTELVFYALAPFLARRGLRFQIVLAALALAYHLGLMALGRYDFATGYYLFPASLWFFSLGMLGFHAAGPGTTLGRWLEARPLRNRVPALGAGLLLAVGALEVLHPPPALSRVLVIAPLLAALIPLLFSMTGRSRIDRGIGDMSYQIYVIHLPMKYFLGQVLGVAAAAALFPWASVAGAAALYLCLDRPIDRFRQRRAAKARQIV
jgi:peptidoglycan/LPS O-acetylase OafA/YrhL